MVELNNLLNLASVSSSFVEQINKAKRLSNRNFTILLRHPLNEIQNNRVFLTFCYKMDLGYSFTNTSI